MSQFEFEFDRSQFSSLTKAQLIDYIEQQNEQLSRFETRFRDVVRAYKGVMKEKEALEISLRAINTSRSTPLREKSHDSLLNASVGDGESEKSEGEVSSAETTKEDSIIEQQDNSTDDQVTTLTQSLTILTEEKAKMESSYQQEKRHLMTQLETANQKLATERHQVTEEMASLRQQLEEAQQKVLLEQKRQQDEEINHGEMIKELKSCLIKEKEKYNILNIKLNESQSLVQTLQKKLSEEKVRESEVHQLTKELEDVRLHLENAELKAKEPSPLLLQLQDDMKTLKMEYEKSLNAEQKRANEAEIKLQTQAKLEEERVANLETKLSELSDIVGGYDRQRELDQAAIQKLKERVSQLDSENTALTQAHVEKSSQLNVELIEQLSTQQDKVGKLRQLLKVATQKILERSQVPHNLEDMTVAEYSDMLASEPSKTKYQEEISELRQEFDTYKQRAQSVLRSKNNKEYESNKELYDLQERYEELTKLIEQLRKESDEEKERHSLALQRLRTEMKQAADKHTRELLQLELEHKQKLQDLQHHIQTTRERTKCLLEEKDKELMLLRGELHGSRISSHSSFLVDQYNDQTILEGSQEDTPSSLNLSLRGNSSIGAVQELLEQPSPSNNDVKFYLHVQEQQRISKELTSLRTRKLELEDNVRELIEREQRHVEQNMLLKEEIRKLERDRSRETENLEYLKNVVFHFMCSDSSNRDQLITPIATILHFTPNEVNIVRKKSAGRLWL